MRLSRTEDQMYLCIQCGIAGYCKRINVPLLTDDEISNSHFVRDLRAFAHSLDVDAADWLEFASDTYRDYGGWIIHPVSKGEVFVEMEPLERAPYEWWRDFCTRACLPGVTPRVRSEAWERARSLGTILRAAYPEEALLWGLRPANDNRPPKAS